MRGKTMRIGGLIALCLIACTAFAACGDKVEKEREKQMAAQIKVIESQLAAVEKHQEAMRGMIKQMQGQLSAMQEELSGEAPRIHAANLALGSLKNLNEFGMGESPAMETAEEPGWSYLNIMFLLLFVFILWLMVRMRHRAAG